MHLPIINDSCRTMLNQNAFTKRLFYPKAWHVCHLWVCALACANLNVMATANFPPTDLWHIGRNVEEYFCVNFHIDTVKTQQSTLVFVLSSRHIVNSGIVGIHPFPEAFLYSNFVNGTVRKCIYDHWWSTCVRAKSLFSVSETGTDSINLNIVAISLRTTENDYDFDRCSK